MLVGCGGIGSWTGLQLAMLGIKELTLVDFDTVETSNLNRQFFYESDIKKYKADVLKDKLEFINSKMKIINLRFPIENINEVYFKDVDFVFDCLDNIPTREYLEKVCWNLNKPFIHSACSDVVGEIQLVVKGKTKRMMKYPDNMKKLQERRSCNDFDPAICTTNMITASLQIDKFLDYLINRKVNKPITHYIRDMGIKYA